jgi:dihydrofolate reductase
MIKAIFAMGNSGEFGLNMAMPWKNISKDMEHFKEYTKGCTLVMGRKTFESLPGKLPGRPHVVICSTPVDGADEQIVSLNAIKRIVGDVCIIGGPQVILDALNYLLVTEVSISHINGRFDSDVSMDVDKLDTLLKYGDVNVVNKYFNGEPKCIPNSNT